MTDLLRGALGIGVGASPFPWQRRLLDELLAGRIPRALDLPTGLGKTSVMAIWLVARAQGGELPRRLVYVVDRRAVVDQATSVAMGLRAWVDADEGVKRALGLERPLAISTLRGQHADNREWLEDPSAPAIIIGTVDMVGSRLLFEGYGISRKMRPYHAGLLGTDTLFVLDEAHLVPAFEHLIESIVGEGGRMFRPASEKSALLPSARLMSLSATGRDHGLDAFRLDDADRKHPVVARRLAASKRLIIAPASNARDLPAAMASRAWELASQSDSPVRVLVFAGRRDHAERAKKELLALARRSGAATPEAELFVGGRRVHERARAAERLSAMGFLAGSRVDRPAHSFLFATSAGEVGVDLDADHAVMDVVAWERIVQRLGRVNRRGDGNAQIHVVPIEDEGPGRDRSDAVLALLGMLPSLSDGSKDASPAGLQIVQETARSDGSISKLARSATTPAPLRPALSRPLVDAWAMTSLTDHTGRPEVGPWLRGWQGARPNTSIVWRARLRQAGEVGLEEYLEATPPHLSERLETETDRVVDWLLVVVKRARERRSQHTRQRSELGMAILDGAGEVVERLDLDHPSLRDSKRKKDLQRRLSGATLLVDAALGGLSDDGMLDAAIQVPATAADASPAWSRWTPAEKAETAEIQASTSEGEDARPPDASDSTLEFGDDTLGEVPFRVVDRGGSYAPVKSRIWREALRLPLSRSADEEVTRWLIVDRWRADLAVEDARATSPRPQRLAEHQEWAEARAIRLAGRLGLIDPISGALAIAARLHDEGKRARRWQQAFRAPDDGEPFAKTRGPVNVRALNGYRHEFGSLRWAEQDSDVRALPEDLRDLVLHLIASHHGFARPLISTGGCEEAPSVVQARARSVALRYLRVTERWGPWGLAYLESILRAADQQASRANDEGKVS